MGRNYDLNISHHARERWLERIIDPNRYSHLTFCKTQNCEHCITLLHNIRNIIKNTRRQIDSKIAETFRIAKKSNKTVTDPGFIHAMSRQHGDLTNYEFYQSLDNKAVFMAKKEIDRLVLCTIMSSDMIGGTVLRADKMYPKERTLLDGCHSVATFG